MAEVHIDSYFSLETDLAAEFREWPEFRSGRGYEVELCDEAERVSVALMKPDDPYVSVVGSVGGQLFDRTLGRVVHALAAHSDNLMINRRS